MNETTNLQRLTTWVRKRIGKGVPDPVMLEVEGEGVLRAEGATVNNEPGPACLVITISKQTLDDVWNDRVHPLKMPKGSVKLSNKLLAVRMAPRLLQLLTTKPSGS